MRKCNCGAEVGDDLFECPNCGMNMKEETNNLDESELDDLEQDDELDDEDEDEGNQIKTSIEENPKIEKADEQRREVKQTSVAKTERPNEQITPKREEEKIQPKKDDISSIMVQSLNEFQKNISGEFEKQISKVNNELLNLKTELDKEKSERIKKEKEQKEKVESEEQDDENDEAEEIMKKKRKTKFDEDDDIDQLKEKLKRERQSEEEKNQPTYRVGIIARYKQGSKLKKISFLTNHMKYGKMPKTQDDILTLRSEVGDGRKFYVIKNGTMESMGVIDCSLSNTFPGYTKYPYIIDGNVYSDEELGLDDEVKSPEEKNEEIKASFYNKDMEKNLEEKTRENEELKSKLDNVMKMIENDREERKAEKKAEEERKKIEADEIKREKEKEQAKKEREEEKKQYQASIDKLEVTIQEIKKSKEEGNKDKESDFDKIMKTLKFIDTIKEQVSPKDANGDEKFNILLEELKNIAQDKSDKAKQSETMQTINSAKEAIIEAIPVLAEAFGNKNPSQNNEKTPSQKQIESGENSAGNPLPGKKQTYLTNEGRITLTVVHNKIKKAKVVFEKNNEEETKVFIKNFVKDIISQTKNNEKQRKLLKDYAAGGVEVTLNELTKFISKIQTASNLSKLDDQKLSDMIDLIEYIRSTDYVYAICENILQIISDELNIKKKIDAIKDETIRKQQEEQERIKQEEETIAETIKQEQEKIKQDKEFLKKRSEISKKQLKPNPDIKAEEKPKPTKLNEKLNKVIETTTKKEEEPKVEEPKVEEPKVEEPKVEEPKVEEPKVEPEDKEDTY